MKIQYKKEEIFMAQMKSIDLVQHIWKITVVGAVLTLLGLLLPACYSDLSYLRDTWMWFFGFWFTTSEYFYKTSGWPSDFYVEPYDDDLMIAGAVATVLLIIALILMATASKTGKQGGRNNVVAGTSLFGGILAIIGPVFYYYYIDAELSMTYYGYSVNIHWTFFDPSFGYYLPIIGGILGIIGGILAGYAYSQEKRGGVSKYQPQPMEKTTRMAKNIDQSQELGQKFCPNCGAKLTGSFCQECGTKAF
jgi:hypothetical protein